MKNHQNTSARKAGIDSRLSAEDKEKLREMAFQAIRFRCMGEKMPDIAVESPRLKELGAVFVCIHKGKDLRGCIGTIEPILPLWEAIKRVAVEAAFGDPRFCALASEELDKIDIEVSVLTPLQGISDPSEIEIGKHGLFIRKGVRSGLLLPQVATEHNFDREQFLDCTCRKAGLPEKAWQDKDVEMFIFSADVF